MTCYLYGAGGHGKVVLEAMRQSKINCDGFIDDDKTINEWDGLPVFNIDILQNMNNQNINLHLAIGNCNLRESASRKLNKFSFISIIHPSAIVSGSAKIDHGNFLAAGIVLGPDTKVGKHCIINHLAVVDHDCIIGDFCHIAPHAILGGGVKIGNGVLIGAGATILPSIIIGDNAIIGAGAVVTKNIQAGMSVVGNPALPLDS